MFPGHNNLFGGFFNMYPRGELTASNWTAKRRRGRDSPSPAALFNFMLNSEDDYASSEESSSSSSFADSAEEYSSEDDSQASAKRSRHSREEDYAVISRRFNTSSNKLAPILDAQLIETDCQYDIQIHLPGVDPRNMEVSWDKQAIFVSAEVSNQFDEAVEMISTVRRCFQMPKDVNVEEVSVAYENQFLLVQLPKREDFVEEESEEEEEEYEELDEDDEMEEDSSCTSFSEEDNEDLDFDDSGSMEEVSDSEVEEDDDSGVDFY